MNQDRQNTLILNMANTDYANMDDAELVKRCAGGDEQAFSQIINRYQGMVYGYFLRSGSGHENALDLTQEVFIKLYDYAPKYTPSAHFKTFLFTIARNRWVDYLRKVAGKEPVNLHDEQHLKSGAPTPLETVQAKELRAMVDLAIEQLPPKQKETLILAEVAGLKYNEISEVLDVAVGTVKSRIFNAINNIREYLKKHGMLEE